MDGSSRWRRAASNVLLGITLGLLSYYGLTTVLAGEAQRELRAESVDVPTFAAEQPERLVPEQPSAPVLDFGGWETEDAAAWTGLGPGQVFGRIVIRKIGLDTLVMSSVTPADLKRGPGHITWTDVPGPTGNVGISGHRTTYGAPFRRIDELAEGDTIDLFSQYRMYRYRVARTLIVRPNQVEVVAPTVKPTLTLTACHPLYSARYRIVVQAELVEVRRIAAIVQ